MELRPREVTQLINSWAEIEPKFAYVLKPVVLTTTPSTAIGFHFISQFAWIGNTFLDS